MASKASAVETRHIDYVPESERHGVLWRQGPFWFLGNFQPFTVGIGFIFFSFPQLPPWQVFGTGMVVAIALPQLALRTSNAPAARPGCARSRVSRSNMSCIIATGSPETRSRPTRHDG